MAKNEEGEFELVLGNRQLISVFLIVVILLAVFFSMGYIVGRNSAPGTATESAHNTGSSAPEAPQKASPNSPSASASQETPAAPAAEAPTATHAEQPAPTRSKPDAASPAPTAKPKAEPPPQRVAVAVAGELGPGEYWQVVATARPDAEIIAEALTKKGFHALVSPAPKEGVYRVLVGPLKDAPAQAQTRTELEAAGFKNPLMRKY